MKEVLNLLTIIGQRKEDFEFRHGDDFIMYYKNEKKLVAYIQDPEKPGLIKSLKKVIQKF